MAKELDELVEKNRRSSEKDDEAAVPLGAEKGDASKRNNEHRVCANGGRERIHVP
jgi:hypothetical protein